jgi:hypothetical protein
MPYSVYLLNKHYTKLTNKLMITIAMIALIAAIGSMFIGNMNRNAFARSSHHDHGDNDGNDRHGSSDDRHGSSDDRHGSSDDRHGSSDDRHGSSDDRHGSSDDRHGSSDDHQEEIILSSPGLPQQQLYLNHIHGGNT